MRTLYHNGSILTMDKAQHAAFLITEDDRIAQVGYTAPPSASLIASCDSVVDLAGACLLPAFIDAHSHFMSLATSLLQVSLDGVKSEEEIIQRISAFFDKHKLEKGEWIVAKGYDHEKLSPCAHPSRAIIDSRFPENPVALVHASGHLGVFNLRAMTALGLSESTPPCDGGAFDFGTGLAEEGVLFDALKRIPMPTLGAILSACQEAQRIYASHGIATLQEGMMVKEMIPLYRALCESNTLMCDVVGYASVEDAPELFDTFFSEYRRHFRLGGLKIFLDGSPQGKTAWLRESYLGGEDCGYGTMSDDELLLALRYAAKHGRQLLAHCNGDRACDQFIDAAKIVAAEYPSFTLQRHVMIHSQLLPRDRLDEVKALGIIPSFFVAHVYHWGDVHLKNLGKSRASAISPAASAQRCGITFTFHQDTPVIPPSMTETLWCAVNRRTRDGAVLGEDERISTQAALQALTISSAYQYFEEAHKGSLSKGKAADLVILDRDPLLCPPEELCDIKVMQTIKGGRVIYRAT